MKSVTTFLFVVFCSTAVSTAQRSFAHRLSDAAIELTDQQVRYDPSYYVIGYPGGDVPEDRGVCTDVIIRAYRKVGIDLQKEVHEDMAANFGSYPKNWGLSRPDKNIDHRRVPNMMRFFVRQGITKPVTHAAEDYYPGDIVFWNLGRGILHVGIVADRRSADNERYLIVHNIGSGQVMEDCLFSYAITGHFQYPLRNESETDD